MLMATKVPPKSTAPTSAAGTPPATPAAAIPTACTNSAAVNNAGWDHRVLIAAHSAADGTVARPTTSQVLPPNHPGAS
ncbi:hypothetical protein AFA91_12125 [Mycolicibacterium goodii]|uniref:Uncharacterized protein n=1 Tax=Mycolicibacterium goodii TaxID=134601 RepID=A0A0K0X559_MYCGD|nr:hypothetical protein AFA91_12125 [Mycolicibacterium goodii]